MSLNLVAYGASDDESDDAMDETPGGSVAVVVNPPSNNQTATTGSSRPTKAAVISNSESGDIPKPSQKELELAEMARKEKANISSKSDLFSAQKKGGRIVIGIPSLAELEDDAEETKKAKKPTFSVGKGQSKLFSKLPPPKNASYEPPVNSLDTTATPGKTSAFKKSVPLIPQAVVKKQLPIKKGSDDEDEDMTTSGSFFTMDEPELKEVHVPEPVPLVAYTQPQITQSYDTIPTNQQYNLAGIPDSVIMEQQQAAQMELDDVALQALQGTSGVKRKLPDDAQVIDIQGERLTYDPNMSYLKSMSEEKIESRGPDITYNKVHKKKHQITYLAAQAKAREVELKNQWAQNKASKRQTQAKYGF